MAIRLKKPDLRGAAWLERVLSIAELVLIALIIAVLAIGGLRMFAPGSQLVLPPKPFTDPALTSAPVEVDISILTGFNPFHRDMEAVQALESISAPETTLNLKVHGMRAHLDGQTSSAIIQTPDNKQATYFLSDEIIPGVTLKSVEIDYVILDRNGVTERLSRQGRKESEEKTGMQPAVVDTAMFYEASQMIRDIRFYPHMEGRTVIGYRVIPTSGQSLKKYGFQRGDIITGINGENLAQERVNLPNLWKNLNSAPYASIQIIRDDQPMTIDVNLQ